MSNQVWVAADGSWGDAEIKFFNTEKWTQEDFNELDDANDSDRLEVAQVIEYRRNK